MELGFVGLGRMGKNMVLRLLRGNHRVVAWARTPSDVGKAAWLFLAEKVRNRHNRLHPETLVDKIVLRREKWILTSDGYAAGRGNPTNDVTSLVLSADNPAP